MILVKLKVHSQPKDRIAKVTQEQADRLIKAHPTMFSLVEEKLKATKPKEAKETK